MSYIKRTVTIITLLILLLLTMSTTIQAASVGKTYDLDATMNGSQIKLTWSSVSEAMGYNVYVNNTRIGSVNTNEASLIGFSNNTTYRFKIAAYDSQRREGIVSEEIRFTTDGKETLGKVSNLTVSQVNGFVTLNWNSVKYADKYQVFVEVPNFGEINVGEVTTTNAMLQGFKEGQKYGFSIRACETLNSGGVNYGEKSNKQYCTINSNIDDDYNQNIGKVTGVTVDDITDTEATVTWSKLNNADGYEVLLSKNNGSYKKVADKTTRYVYLSNLTPDSSYRVKVVAYEKINGEKEYGEESIPHSFTTEKSTKVGSVSGLTISDITKNSAYVSWSKADNATGYNIYVSEDYGSFRYWTSTTSKNYTLKNLDANTYYKVKIEGYRIVSGTEYTGNVAIKGFTTSKETTNITKLATVTHLNAQVKNRNEAYLSWWPVDDATGYEIYLAEKGKDYERIGWTTDCSYIITSDKLDYSTNYKVRVRAYKNTWKDSSHTKVNTTYGNYSSVESFKTERYISTQNNSAVGKVKNVYCPVSGNGVYLSWTKINGAAGYEIDFNVPGVGSVTLYSDSNTKVVTGVTETEYYYTARIRAYKYINGVKKYGEYSDPVKFKAAK